jgi:ribosomal protein S18 acetylase RimI-like enzyme
MTFQIEPLQQIHFDGLHDVFDAVCKERRFLAFTSAGSKEDTFAFYGRALAGGHSHFVAVQGRQVLGWCDVLPLYGEMRAHVGVLGLGVAATHRGRGIGSALMRAAIEKAAKRGLSRIELTVNADNAVAQALYIRMGFEREGTQRDGWCLDGQWMDVHFMARLRRPGG